MLNFLWVVSIKAPTFLQSLHRGKFQTTLQLVFGPLAAAKPMHWDRCSTVRLQRLRQIFAPRFTVLARQSLTLRTLLELAREQFFRFLGATENVGPMASKWNRCVRFGRQRECLHSHLARKKRRKKYGASQMQSATKQKLWRTQQL